MSEKRYSNERTVREPSATRYDLLLAVVPISLLGGALLGALTGAGVRTGVVAGSVLAGCAVAYGVFGDPPTRRGGRSAT